MDSHAKFYIDKLLQFVDGKIVGVVNSPDGFFGLTIKVKNDTKVLWFLSDDEGNNPGSFDIQSEK